MAKQRIVKARNGIELAKAIGLPPSAAYEWRARSELASQLISIVEKNNLTHAHVANVAKTSRTRVTAILNRNLEHVSTDLLIRILGALGYTVKLSVSKGRVAA
jgi:predicted XRE-type DNA-binding protein